MSSQICVFLRSIPKCRMLQHTAKRYASVASFIASDGYVQVPSKSKTILVLSEYSLFRRHFFSRIKKSSTHSTTEMVVKEYSPKELTRLEKISKRISKDSLVTVSAEEASNFLVPLPRSDFSLFQEWKFKLWDRNKEPKFTAWKFIHLILERLENEALTGIFDIDDNFNGRAYFYMLHVWFLHRRLIKEGFAGKSIDEALFDYSWTVFKDWLLLKNTPEHQFESELRNCQSFMLGFCVALDAALEYSETSPGRVKDILYSTVYSEEIPQDAPFLELLTKYLFRQVSYIMHVERDHFLLGYFVWANFPVVDVLSKPKVIGPLSHRISYGGYKPPNIDNVKLLKRGVILPHIRESSPAEIMSQSKHLIEQ